MSSGSKGWQLDAKPQCFVIQPFDAGKYDKRYEDVYAPAICDAGLEPYRVDRDPRAGVPIDEIERHISDSAVCFAEISEDNPNVWFELGVAVAQNKELALVCSEDRTRFPFDVQHRSIIRYKTDSQQDFIALRGKVTERLTAAIAVQRSRETAIDLSPVRAVAGLAGHEEALLILAAQRMDAATDAVSSYVLRRDMAASGFNELAYVLSIRSLTRRGFIEPEDMQDADGGMYTGHRVCEDGFDWLERNQQRFNLRQETSVGDSAGHLVGLDDLPY